MFKVMLRCETGTTVIHYNPLRWDRPEHVVTWCVEETRAAAEAVVRDLLAGRSQGLRRAWIEETVDRLPPCDICRAGVPCGYSVCPACGRSGRLH